MSLVKTSEDIICRCGICMSQCVFPYDGQEPEISRHNFGAISGKTLNVILSCPHSLRQDAVIFVGGFMDTLFCSLLRLAGAYSEANPEQDVWYATYDSQKQIAKILETYNRAQRRIILVGHSWGGDSAARLLAAHPELCVNLLVTLDPVSTKGPPSKNPNMGAWVNFYVNYTLSRPHRSNFLARIGGPWGEAPAADLNITQEEWGAMPHSTGQKQLADLHHSDVKWMLCHAPLAELWNKALPGSRLMCRV
ncbi:MAG: hypothetical protein IJD04_04305 [Desulfovibrionaceae bacterium]|nr:hypothetical protein [Desulfovibrionaceae bacterium]